MFGVKSLELIRELKRCDTDGKGFLPTYNDKLLHQVFEEMQELFEHNQRDVSDMVSEEDRESIFTAVKMRHYGLIRNHRCVVAYLMGRLTYIKTLRWGFGTVIPTDIQRAMSEGESAWFETYNKLLFNYMKSATDDGLDLCTERDPPKFRFITVRCMVDYGDLLLADGTKVVLKKGLQHLLPRQDCEQLIRLGVLEHVLS